MAMSKKWVGLKTAIFRSTGNILILRQIFNKRCPQFDDNYDDVGSVDICYIGPLEIQGNH